MDGDRVGAVTESLAEVTLALDREAELDIISRIARENPELASGLKSLVDGLEMAALRTLLKEART